MTAHDLLLEWLSCRGRASAATLSKACTALSTRLGLVQDEEDHDERRRLRFRLLEPLRRIGHVERDSRNGLVVAPSTLVLQESVGRFYGARTGWLRQKLSEALGDQFQTIEQVRGPEVWEVKAPEADLRRLGERLRFNLVEERGRQLLAALPPLVEIRHQLAGETPPEARWERFEVVTKASRVFARWRSSPSLQATGLHREAGRRPPRYFYCWEGKVYRVKQSEEKLALRWVEFTDATRTTLRYRKGAKELSVPFIRVPLPLIIDRGLCLASARSPSAARNSSIYHQIEPERAWSLSRILGIPLESLE